MPGTDRGEEYAAGLDGGARLRALSALGLSAAADPELDLYAGWVRRALDVPVALVSLVNTDLQYFPGMAGLPEPVATARCTPLTHSFCRHVVLSARPLLVEDARQHPALRDNPAIAELGVVAYAGLPLIDDQGNVLGSLCAIDDRPRAWSAEQVDDLRRLAVGCTAELRLRLARVEAERERLRRDELESRLRRSFDDSQTLLTASQAFTATTTVEDVYARIGELVDSDLEPGFIAVSLLDGDHLHRLADPRFPPRRPGPEPSARYGLDSETPSAAAIRRRQVLHYPDRESLDAEYPAPTRRLLDQMDLQALVSAPIMGIDGPLGALVLGWDRPRQLSAPELLIVSTISGYAAAAIERARHRQHREHMVHRLQQAMLTELPDSPALPMAASYRPADARSNVGGDWYDAVCLLDTEEAGMVCALSVGDVAGHDMEAAAVMGQVRSMLRQAAYMSPASAPSEILGAFERANIGCGLDASGSAVLATLRCPPRGPAVLEWTNAGHPPPIVVAPDGSTALLECHDAVFGYGLPAGPRLDHRVDLSPGSVVFLYTDGLVERSGRVIDDGIDRLRRRLGEYRDLPLGRLLERVVADSAPAAIDDVVAFAVRIPRRDG